MLDVKNKLDIYIKNNLFKDKTNLFKKVKDLYSNMFNEEEFEDNNSDNLDIDNFIAKHSKYNDFQTMLFKFIDSKNLKDSDVYNKVHIDRRLFSKIRNDKKYHPSKETVILLAISLELSENELDELLESASYSLPKNNEFDLIIRFCFINKIFKIADINELLYEYDCKLFYY